MIKKILWYLLLGVLWGNTFLVINFVIIQITDGTIANSVLLEDFAGTAIRFIIIGIGVATGTIVYSIERFSLWQQSAIHLTAALCAYTIGWLTLVEPSLSVAATNIFNFLLIFFVGWFGFYLYYKYEAKKINEALKKQREQNE